MNHFRRATMRLRPLLKKIEDVLNYYPIFYNTTRKNCFPGYTQVFENNAVSLFRPSITGKKVVAAWNGVVCASPFINKNVIYLYPNYQNMQRKYVIHLNNKSFPELIENSKIQSCLIIPYVRQIEKNRPKPSWRLVIITDKCQVYHNFPAHGKEFEGEECYRDITRFAESAVWDLPGNKYPSKDSNCDECEYYYPFLPEASYEYHPSIRRGDNRFGSICTGKTYEYEENGKTVKLSRFYFPIRSAECNSFSFMGGYEPDYKMTLIGTYCSNLEHGSRIVVFATSDGGRNFFAKYEFNDNGRTENYGNPLNPTALACTPDNPELWINQRTLTYNDTQKWTYESKIKVLGIDLSKSIILEVEENESIESGNVILLSGNSSTIQWNSLLNKLYKVKKLSTSRIELYELVSRSKTNLPCRHIHCINRTKDGWLIGTGETYPNGWLLFLQMKAADNYTRVCASSKCEFIQLNYSKDSLQRIIGSVLFDDPNNTLLVASDSPFVKRPVFYKALTHSSTGIYKGKLEDADDFTKYTCICELKEPCYFFKEINGVLIAVTQRGELAFSNDRGVSWKINRIDRQLSHYFGQTPQFICLDGWLLRFK